MARALLRQVATALERYRLDVGHYPTEEEGGLEALTTRPAYDDEKLREQWCGPYVERNPLDTWGNALAYELVEGDRPAFALSSAGPDGVFGTADDIVHGPPNAGR